MNVHLLTCGPYGNLHCLDQPYAIHLYAPTASKLLFQSNSPRLRCTSKVFIFYKYQSDLIHVLCADSLVFSRVWIPHWLPFASIFV